MAAFFNITILLYNSSADKLQTFYAIQKYFLPKAAEKTANPPKAAVFRGFACIVRK
jgi:hypothetical protein